MSSRTTVFVCTIVFCTAAGAQAVFVHPGCLSTQGDLDRVADKIAVNAQPWKGCWDRLVGNTGGYLDDAPLAQSTVYVGGGYTENYIRLAMDCAKAYQCALRYHGSGDTAYGNKAVQIMNAWASTHTGWAGDTNVSLRAGLYGYQFACAGELMRNYSGWSAADFTAFQDYMVNVFYSKNDYFLDYHHGTCSDHYWANWDLANVASKMAIGVLADRQDIFDEGVDYFFNGSGTGNIHNALYYVHPDGSGQYQESGRDQGHSVMGPQLLGAICEIAWNQGIDLYGYERDMVLAACEYVAKYNLWYDDLPWVRFINCEYEVHWQIASWGGRGAGRPGWDLIYNHYVNRLGMSAPYSEMFADIVRPEGGGFNYGTTSGGFDGLGFTTLTHSLDPFPTGTVPSRLRPVVEGHKVTVSWRGTPYAESYNVKRSAVSGGPYDTIAAIATRDNYYVDAGLTQGTTYYYVVSANTPNGESGDSAEASAAADGQLYGTVIGTPGSWNNKGAERELVFDGSLKNFFDAPDSVSWAGLDLGEGVSAVITQVKYCPRRYYSGRMTGGKFQGSNTADFSSGVTDLFTITSAPAEGVLTMQNISSPAAFRYVRYISPAGGYGNAAEVQFFGIAAGLEAPVVPNGLNAAAVSSYQADVAWNAVPGAAGYYVKRAVISGGPYTIVANGRFTSFSDTDLKGGKTYHYVVSALNNEGQSADSAEVAVTTPVQLVNVAPGGNVWASRDNSAWNPAEGAASACDGVISTKWYTGGNSGYAGWLKADLGQGNAQMVVRYDLTSANDVPGRDPSNWKLYGSNDAAAWTLLDTRTGEVFAERYQTRQYSISNTTAYRYYQLNVTSNYSGSTADGVQLSEWALMAPLPTFAVGLINNLDAVESRDYAGHSLPGYVNGSGAFTKTSGPDWLTVLSDGTLSGVPLQSHVGENRFTVCVAGPSGYSDTAAMIIHVANLYTGTEGFEDVLGLAEQWLMADCTDTPACRGADLDGDADVNLSDFKELGRLWQNGM